MENRKKDYGGKYSKNPINARGYYGRNEAGIAREGKSNTAGVRREFVGTRSRQFTFFNTSIGMRTITAESFEEALRIAKSLGYTQGDYKKR